MSTPHGFDELIHAPTRLSIVALLSVSEWAEFTFVRDSLSMSDSALSKQVARWKRPGTWWSARPVPGAAGVPSFS